MGMTMGYFRRLEPPSQKQMDVPTERQGRMNVCSSDHAHQSEGRRARDRCGRTSLVLLVDQEQQVERRARCFVCSASHCNGKACYTTHDVFLVMGSHVCAFEHEREFRKRTKGSLAVDAMSDNVLLRNRDVVSTVRGKAELSRRE